VRADEGLLFYTFFSRTEENLSTLTLATRLPLQQAGEGIWIYNGKIAANISKIGEVVAKYRIMQRKTLDYAAKKSLSHLLTP